MPEPQSGERRYRVIEIKSWSYIELPGGALDGPWRYRWEAEEHAERLAMRANNDA